MNPKLSTLNKNDTPARGRPPRALTSPEALLPRLIEATESLVSIGPRLLPCRVLAYRDALVPGVKGAYVALLGAWDALHIGILADDASCIALARRMSSTGDLDSVSVRTRICDIARQLGLALGQEMGDPHLAHLPELAVSEPIFVDGIAHHTHDACLRAAEVALGGTHATLVVVARRNES